MVDYQNYNMGDPFVEESWKRPRGIRSYNKNEKLQHNTSSISKACNKNKRSSSKDSNIILSSEEKLFRKEHHNINKSYKSASSKPRKSYQKFKNSINKENFSHSSDLH